LFRKKSVIHTRLNKNNLYILLHTNFSTLSIKNMTNGKCIFTLFLSLVCYATVWAQAKVTILDHKDRIRITPVSILNSAYRETNLSITPNGKYMYFMTVRGQQPWSNQYMEYQGQCMAKTHVFTVWHQYSKWRR
jgi:hypothetical protein